MFRFLILTLLFFGVHLAMSFDMDGYSEKSMKYCQTKNALFVKKVSMIFLRRSKVLGKGVCKQEVIQSLVKNNCKNNKDVQTNCIEIYNIFKEFRFRGRIIGE